MFTIGANAIKDREVHEFVQQCLHSISYSDLDKFNQRSCVHDLFAEWAGQGIDSDKSFYDHVTTNYDSYSTNGISQSIELFLARHSDRRLRYYPGEYGYGRILAAKFGIRQAAISYNEEFERGDMLILSWPFAAGTWPCTYGYDGEYQDCSGVLNMAKAAKVPVLMDMAYMGTSSNILLSLNDSVESYCFSISKPFGLGAVRYGIEYSKYDYERHPLYALNNNNYTNRIGEFLTMKLCEKYQVDYLFKTYREKQAKLCDVMGLIPSDIVMFGLSHEEKWNDYSRDGAINRVCLSEILSRAS